MCLNVYKCVWMCSINVRTFVGSHNNDNYNNKNKRSAFNINLCERTNKFVKFVIVTPLNFYFI